jgi:hypothetical protein
MSERKYEVYENENRIASNMSLEMALLFIKAYCDEYYNEKVRLTLVKMEGRHDGEWSNGT